MTTAHDDVPFDLDEDVSLQLQDEVDRKMNETLIDILTRQQEHLYTGREARIAIRTLFSAVQGLVSPQYSELLNDAITEVARVETPEPLPAQLFFRGNVVLLDIEREKHMVTLKMISPAGSVVSNEYEYPDEASTFKGGVSRLIGMIKAGAKRI